MHLLCGHLAPPASTFHAGKYGGTLGGGAHPTDVHPAVDARATYRMEGRTEAHPLTRTPRWTRAPPTVFADGAALVRLVHGVHALGLGTRGHGAQHLPAGLAAAALARGHLQHKPQSGRPSFPHPTLHTRPCLRPSPPLSPHTPALSPRRWEDSPGPRHVVFRGHRPGVRGPGAQTQVGPVSPLSAPSGQPIGFGRHTVVWANIAQRLQPTEPLPLSMWTGQAPSPGPCAPTQPTAPR